LLLCQKTPQDEAVKVRAVWLLTATSAHCMV
jgi:hypothetical protein